MFLGFAFIIGGLALLMGLERVFPDRTLAEVPNWWVRVLGINLAQLFIVVMGAYTWETYFLTVPTMISLKDLEFMTPALGGFIAYLVNSYIFYWFHRARHEVYLFWILFHQVHHSPSRIEAITSFYKHPLEILIDSILMTVLLYPILGLSSSSSIWLSIFSAYGEYFYHMNIKTPHWIGYFFQRPESHRVHHVRDKRTNCRNYSDFPLWDMLGDTYHNPTVDSVPTGYSDGYENRFTDMLLFKDVLSFKDNKKAGKTGLTCQNFLSLGLLIIGLLSTFGYLFNQPSVRGLGLITTASPLPLVFSAYNGVETFRTSFEIELHFITLKFLDGTTGMKPASTVALNLTIPLTKELYSKIEGPYNRRNVFGVLFSHGPFFPQNSKVLQLRDQLLRYAICKNRLGMRLNSEAFEDYSEGIDNSRGLLLLDSARIKVSSRRNSKDMDETSKTWDMWISCLDD